MRTFKNQAFNKRLGFAMTGLAAGLRLEHSLRYQLLALAGVVLMLAIFRLEPLWWALIALTSSAVICAELLNTALEHLADHLHPQEHQRIQLVKDFAAAAVLVAAVGALAVAAATVVHMCTRA